MDMDKKMMQSVQVIIERLKTNPEDFFGEIAPKRVSRVPPKFEEITQKLDDLIAEKNVGHIHRLWFLNEDEKDALIEAYKEARRARFEAKTFHELLSPQEPDLSLERMDASGKRLMQGWTDPRAAGAQVQTQNVLGAEISKRIRDEFTKQYAKNRNT
jgi:hypothetical protein